MHSGVLERIHAALDDVPVAAYSVPHVYPSAAPAYVSSPRTARPRSALRELRLYAHVPFCRYHCAFCYFAVRVGGLDVMDRYVGALERELGWIAPGTPLSQLFVGGGTPTALPAELLDRMLGAIFARTTPLAGPVHTVETSPETISPAHVDVLRRHGIGRVSMGVQSLHGEILEGVNRRHSREEALAGCELLVGSGFILNVDLIYGLPGQSEESFVADVREIVRRGVPSLTLYSLRTTEQTPVVRSLRRGERFDLPRLMRWRSLVRATAEELGYTQTRWHTFKRLDSIASRHERLPCFGDDMRGYQLGIGMSARSHLGHVVYRNHDRIPEYVKRVEADESPVEQIFELGEEDRMTQFVARSIGDGKRLSRAHYEHTFGRSIDDDFAPRLARLASADLIEDNGATIALTELGTLVYDLVTLAFYPARAQAWLAARETRASFVDRPAMSAS